jgi:hypothetical protein
MTKLLIGLGGESGRFTDTVEIIDLESSSPTCQNLPSFPLATLGSFGGLGFQDQPMICGGYDSNKCYTLVENEWTPSPSLKTARYLAAVSKPPYSSKPQKLFVTGGSNQSSVEGLNTAEVLTEQGWETLPQKLPVTIYRHCQVHVNSTTVMVIGGLQNGSKSAKTFYFNTENDAWTEGPQLKNARDSHSCGRIRKDSNSPDFSIIVAGGNDGHTLSYVEILDHGSNQWRKGPDLPYPTENAQMVEDKKGGVVLVGGWKLPTLYANTLFQLPHGGEDAEWTVMEQKLKNRRENPVAFLVPDSIVTCS